MLISSLSLPLILGAKKNIENCVHCNGSFFECIKKNERHTCAHIPASISIATFTMKNVMRERLLIFKTTNDIKYIV